MDNDRYLSLSRGIVSRAHSVGDRCLSEAPVSSFFFFVWTTDLFRHQQGLKQTRDSVTRNDS